MNSICGFSIRKYFAASRRVLNTHTSILRKNGNKTRRNSIVFFLCRNWIEAIAFIDIRFSDWKTVTCSAARAKHKGQNRIEKRLSEKERKRVRSLDTHVKQAHVDCEIIVLTVLYDCSTLVLNKLLSHAHTHARHDAFGDILFEANRTVSFLQWISIECNGKYMAVYVWLCKVVNLFSLRFVTSQRDNNGRRENRNYNRQIESHLKMLNVFGIPEWFPFHTIVCEISNEWADRNLQGLNRRCSTERWK